METMKTNFLNKLDKVTYVLDVKYSLNVVLNDGKSWLKKIIRLIAIHFPYSWDLLFLSSSYSV